MAIRVVQRKSVGKQIIFRDLNIGDPFAVAPDAWDLFIKTSTVSAIRIPEVGTGSEVEVIDQDRICLEVDASIEWCIAGSI